MRASFLLFGFLISFYAGAQIRCGNMDSVDPEFEEVIRMIRLQKAGARLSAELEIPLHIHILLDTDKEISDDQVFSQMVATNMDYADHFKFSLKQVNRVTTSQVFGFNTLEDILDVVPEVPDVLNIWVVDLQSGFLGAASIPWSLAVPGLDSATLQVSTLPLGMHGLVIDYKVFGVGEEYDLDSRFNLGRTVTHEIGHFLGLHHPWGLLQNCQNDDFCADTPEQSDVVFGCPESQVSQCSAELLDLSNYMQFLNDECMDHFTSCQLDRMRIVSEASLTHLLNSPSLALPDYSYITGILSQKSEAIELFPNPTRTGRFTITPEGRPITIFDITGKPVYRGLSGTVDLGRTGLFVVKIEIDRSDVRTFKLWSK